jgi:hypothetical protein
MQRIEGNRSTGHSGPTYSAADDPRVQWPSFQPDLFASLVEQPFISPDSLISCCSSCVKLSPLSRETPIPLFGPRVCWATRSQSMLWASTGPPPGRHLPRRPLPQLPVPERTVRGSRPPGHPSPIRDHAPALEAAGNSDYLTTNLRQVNTYKAILSVLGRCHLEVLAGELQ